MVNWKLTYNFRWGWNEKIIYYINVKKKALNFGEYFNISLWFQFDFKIEDNKASINEKINTSLKILNT